MNITEISLKASVPAEEAAELEAALRRVLAEHGTNAASVSITSRTISEELRELGLPTQLNKALTAAGLGTIDLVCDRTEADLLALRGEIRIGYPYLRTIIQKLASLPTPRHLRGSEIAVEDLVEQLDITPGSYERLKKAGYHSLSRITAQDLVGLSQVLPDAIGGLQWALAQLELAWSPLHPDRTLAELRLPEDLVKVLKQAGCTPSDRVHDYNEHDLRERLSQVPTTDIEYYIGRIKGAFRHYGHELAA